MSEEDAVATGLGTFEVSCNCRLFIYSYFSLLHAVCSVLKFPVLARSNSLISNIRQECLHSNIVSAIAICAVM